MKGKFARGRSAAVRLALGVSVLGALCAGCGLQVSLSAAPQPAPLGANITYTVTVTNQAGCTVGPPLGFVLVVERQGNIPAALCGLSTGGLPPGISDTSPDAARIHSALEALMASAPLNGIMCVPEFVSGGTQVLVCTLNMSLNAGQMLQTTIESPIPLSGELTAFVAVEGQASGSGCNSNVTTGTAAGTACTNLVIQVGAPAVSHSGLVALGVALVGGGILLIVRRRRPPLLDS